MGPTISSTAETVPFAPPPRATVRPVVVEAAAEESSLDGVGLEESAEWRSSRGRDRNIREAAGGSPWMGGGGGERRDLYGHSRRRRRRKWAWR